MFPSFPGGPRHGCRAHGDKGAGLQTPNLSIPAKPQPQECLAAGVTPIGNGERIRTAFPLRPPSTPRPPKRFGSWQVDGFFGGAGKEASACRRMRDGLTKMLHGSRSPRCGGAGSGRGSAGRREGRRGGRLPAPLPAQAAPASLPTRFEAALKENFQLVRLGSILLGGSGGGFSLSQFTPFGAQ